MLSSKQLWRRCCRLPDSWQLQIHVTVNSISTTPTQNKQYKYMGKQANLKHIRRGFWNPFVLANLNNKKKERKRKKTALYYSCKAPSSFTWVLLVSHFHRGICGHPLQRMLQCFCNSLFCWDASVSVRVKPDASTREGGLLLMEVAFVIGWCDWLKWRALIEQCSSPICATMWVHGADSSSLRGKVLHLHHLLCHAEPWAQV